jgi:hypothetical protein
MTKKKTVHEREASALAVLQVDQVKPDMPLRLSVAAALAYPDGSMTASGLRREAARGRLVIERTAGKFYTTLSNIERMRELCRVQAKALDSTSNLRGGTPLVTSPITQPGSSGMADATFSQAALQMKLQKLSST